MLINEACNLTGLTKKAISYYEEQGLVKSQKKDNGYREYFLEEIALLNEISLYRKLDISIKDIKNILNSKNKQEILDGIILDKQKQEIQIKVQKIYLEKIILNKFDKKIINELNEELIEIEKNNGEFIKRELLRVFPTGIGRYLACHFEGYLNEHLDTLEKYNAWIKIVQFLDDLPELEIPKIIEAEYENITDEMIRITSYEAKNKIDEILDAKGEALDTYKKTIIDSIKKQNEDFLVEEMNDINKFKKELNDFLYKNGYYEIFIPNMRILSKSYNDYYNKCMKLNELIYKELE